MKKIALMVLDRVIDVAEKAIERQPETFFNVLNSGYRVNLKKVEEKLIKSARKKLNKERKKA